MKAIVLMPFADEFDDVYKAIRAAITKCATTETAKPAALRRASLAELSCERLDEVAGTYQIMVKIIELIKKSALCIVDVSGAKPNVFWELGFAMALEKPVIVLSQEGDKIPSDLDNLRTLRYARDRLEDTLTTELIVEIETTLSSLPDPASLPTEPAHSRALALSIASPCYFLNSQFKINYMNEAASMLFANDDQPLNAAQWKGQPLRDFVNTFAERIVNLPEVEKNLQIQIEEIREAEASQGRSTIRPYSVERIELETPQYGRLVLQKTGVAVSDASASGIQGWVVSFNVVKPEDAASYSRFHEQHRSMVQGRLFSFEARPGGKERNEAPPAVSQVEVQEWLAREDTPTFHFAENYAEKQRCFEFASTVMKTPAYGLKTVKELDAYFFDYRNTDFVMEFVPGTEILLTVFRLHRDHNLARYRNLDKWIAQLVEEGARFADAGAYFHGAIRNPWRSKALWRLLGYASWKCEENGHDHFYAQVPRNNFDKVRQFYFKRAGDDFETKGWRHHWRPIAVRCDQFRTPDLSCDAGAHGDDEGQKIAFEAYKKARAASANEGILP